MNTVTRTVTPLAHSLAAREEIMVSLNASLAEWRNQLAIERSVVAMTSHPFVVALDSVASMLGKSEGNAFGFVPAKPGRVGASCYTHADALKVAAWVRENHPAGSDVCVITARSVAELRAREVEMLIERVNAFAEQA